MSLYAFVLCVCVRCFFFSIYFQYSRLLSLSIFGSLNNARLTSVFNIPLSYSYKIKSTVCMCVSMCCWIFAIYLLIIIENFSLFFFYLSFDVILISKDEAIVNSNECFFLIVSQLKFEEKKNIHTIFQQNNFLFLANLMKEFFVHLKNDEIVFNCYLPSFSIKWYTPNLIIQFILLVYVFFFLGRFVFRSYLMKLRHFFLLFFPFSVKWEIEFITKIKQTNGMTSIHRLNKKKNGAIRTDR